MFFTQKKLDARIRELASYRYRDTVSIPSFGMIEDNEGEIGEYPPQTPGEKTIQIGDDWCGRDRYVWLSTIINIPREWSNKSIVGQFNFGKGGGGNTSGFEALLFLNGEVLQGVDTNHQEVFLPAELAGNEVALDFRLWSGLEGGGKPLNQEHRIRTAEVAWLDEAVDQLYYDAKAALGTVDVLVESQPERAELLKGLNHAFDYIDWSKPGSDAFYDSVYEAGNVLSQALSTMKSSNPVTIHALGHTHIDVAWLWRLKHTREKAARSFSTVLRLMEKYPEYVFLQTQPQLYDYVKSDYPEIYEQIQKRIKEGRWEAAGDMWLEADCNIPSGESLVRQLLMGTRFFRDELDSECNYLWLPDVFGYSWALPQILKKSGIDTFMTTKISWNQYNRMPHDTFKWRGIDGTEILTHFITTIEPWADGDSWKYTYNGLITPKTVEKSWEAYRDKSLNQDLLLSYGYGDGGGGVNREMLEMRRRLSDMPGLPKVETGRADDYFDRLHEQVDNSDQYVHTWDGELYLELHRGTYTSHANIKKMNRRLELLYRETEWLNVFGMLVNQDATLYPQTALNDGWKIILRNQFHDIIPGSSIHEVYEDSQKEYEEAEEIGRKLWGEAAHSLISCEGNENAYTVMNSAPWPRSGIITISDKAEMTKGKWKDSNGRRLSVECSGNNLLVNLNSVPSMGVDTIYFEPEKGEEHSSKLFDVEESKVVTPYYEVEWNENGQLTQIIDRKAHREVLSSGSIGNVLQVFEDKPMDSDAWDIDIYYQEKMREVNNLKTVQVVETNSLRTVIRFKWSYMDSTITQNMILYANAPRIDFDTNIDWHERHQLLKVAFPVDIRATEATYDIQYGNVKRPTHWNTSWDLARFETVGHQWADLSEKGYGVSLLNNCKYGYDIKNNVMRLSLIKSATDPDYGQDQGEHAFCYSLLPHQGDWVEGNTVREAWELNNPLIYTEGKPKFTSLSLFSLSVNHVMIDAVKKSEDQDKIIIRMHEFSGRRGPVEIKSDMKINSWQECDLMERELGNESNESNLQFNIKPYEIKTFLVILANCSR